MVRWYQQRRQQLQLDEMPFEMSYMCSAGTGAPGPEPTRFMPMTNERIWLVDSYDSSTGTMSGKVYWCHDQPHLSKEQLQQP